MSQPHGGDSAGLDTLVQSGVDASAESLHNLANIRSAIHARVDLLRMVLEQKSFPGRDVVERWVPGGPDNSDTGDLGWLQFYGQLQMWMGEASSNGITTSGAWGTDGMEELRAAHAAEPIRVKLQSGEMVSVFPKGSYAVHRLVLIDFQLRYVIARRVALEAMRETPDLLGALELAIDMQRVLECEFLWILTTPGSDVPWPDDGQEHQAPVGYRAYTPFDQAAVRVAHLQVNMARIHAIAERMKQFEQGGGDSLPLQAFMGVMSSELGVQPRVLDRLWSLGEIFAQAYTKAEATERARAKADAERDESA